MLNFKFCVIGISETWLDDSSQSVEIDGFASFRNLVRENRAGGGVGLFISNDLKFKLRNDLNLK